MPTDVERGNNCHKRVAGYSGWASRIASDPDNEPFLFKKFDDLSALNLLRMQGELYDIQSRLHELDEEDMQDPDISSIQAARNWQTLVMQNNEPEVSCEDQNVSNSGRPALLQKSGVSRKGRTRSKKRMKLYRLLEEKIAAYQDALLRQSQVAQLQRPSERVLQATKQMFHADKFPVIDGQASDYLDAEDLVALKSATQDPLSNYLRKSRLARVNTQTSNPGHTGIGRFKEQQIHDWVTYITIFVAAVFLIGPVLALYFITSASGKLSLVVVFTVGFAASVSAITNAKRAEIFTGTATYAAVLVVFISGDLSAHGTG